MFKWSGDHSSCTASVTCTVCGDVKTDECAVTIDTTEATATTDGSAVYTASITIGEHTYSDTFTVTIPATGTDKPAGGNDKPAADSGTSGSGGSDAPKTGDSSGSAFAYILALVVCGAVIIRMRKHRA